MDTPTTSSYNTVFVDTNLDSHLATIVSDNDTVSDLKKKIVSEHAQCFPNLGDIRINAVKVKCKGYFYHLPDSMLVKGAFERSKKGWFLAVDASTSKQAYDNQLSSNPDATGHALPWITGGPGERNINQPESPVKKLPICDALLLPNPGSIQSLNQNISSVDQSDPGDTHEGILKDVEMEVKHPIDPSKNFSSDPKQKSDFESEKCDLLSQGNKIPVTNIEAGDGPSQVGVNAWEEPLQTDHASKKKHASKEKGEYAGSMKDKSTSTIASQPGIGDTGNSSGNIAKEDVNDMELANVDVGKEPCMPSFPSTSVRSGSGEIHGALSERMDDQSQNIIGDVDSSILLGEVSKTRLSEKRKRKRESKEAENPSEGNKSLVSNFSQEKCKPAAINIENSTVDKQKTSAAVADCLFTELPENNQVGTNSRSGKKKKRKLPRDEAVATEPSSLHVGEGSLKENVEGKSYNAANSQLEMLPAHLGPSEKCKHSESIQEDVDGVDANVPGAANAEGKNDFSEPVVSCGSKGKKKSKKHYSANEEEFPSVAINESELGTTHSDKIEEQRKFLQHPDPAVVQSEKCDLPSQGKTNMHSKEPLLLAEKCSVQRIKKRVNKSVVPKQVMSNMENADDSASGISSTAPHLITGANEESEMKKEERFLAETERTKPKAKLKPVDISFTAANEESEDMGRNGAESSALTQVNKYPKIGENIDGSIRKKAKKNRSSGAKTCADVSVKQQENEVESLHLNQTDLKPKNANDIDEKSKKKTKTKKNQNSATKDLTDVPIKLQEAIEELPTSNDGQKVVDVPSKPTKKTRLAKTNPMDQLTGQGCEKIEYSGTQHGSFHPEQTSRNTDSKQVSLSDKHDGNDIVVKNSGATDANCQIEVPECDGNGVSFKDYFMPGKRNHEAGAADLVFEKFSEEDRFDRDVKGKKIDGDPVPSSAISFDTKNLPKSHSKQGRERKSHVRISDGMKHRESLSKDEQHNDAELKLKSSKSSESGVKAPDSHDVDQKKTIPQRIREAKQPNNVNVSKASRLVPTYPEVNGDSSSSTSSRFDSPEKRFQGRKKTKHQLTLDRHHGKKNSNGSTRKRGEVVNGSQHDKSLLATPGAIFRDGSSESSGDENGTVNSDASTRTPSDNSSSSGYSEVESKSNLDTPRNGIPGAKENNVGESKIKSQGSGPRNITIDAILRSSKRFKKAKLTAESQQDDMESQPVEFVPESQLNL
ncbi:hypothetical protein NMG60_11030860 [Bertholletia excelsa]